MAKRKYQQRNSCSQPSAAGKSTDFLDRDINHNCDPNAYVLFSYEATYKLQNVYVLSPLDERAFLAEHPRERVAYRKFEDGALAIMLEPMTPAEVTMGSINIANRAVAIEWARMVIEQRVQSLKNKRGTAAKETVS